jgi:hypothetical protein
MQWIYVVIVGPTTPLEPPSEMSGEVLRTIGPKVRWLGPVTGPGAFRTSTHQETGVVTTISPPRATVRSYDSHRGGDLRLPRRRIGHLLAEEH